ncbi:MAG: DNA primase [Alphaproteobacteria bacterium]
MRYPSWFLDQLRERLSLSSVVGRRVRLVKAGREYKGCCPFHEEKSPSFTVNDIKGFYHCFGCGAHGSALDFLINHDRLSFDDAVKEAATMAGLPLPQREELSENDKKKKSREEQWFNLLDMAANWYAQQLYHAPSARVARNYLEQRQLPREWQQKFTLGFAPQDGHEFLEACRKAGFDDHLLIDVGLARKDEQGKSRAFFRNRLMFPIRDRKGRVVAFGGRILSGDGPKYINSPDHPLFHKSQLLYGLDKASQLRSGKIVLAEGYMDVIALHRAGFGRAMAPLGTAITEEQIEILWKTSDSPPIACLDGDKAGLKAAMRLAERLLPLITAEKTMNIAFLPANEDPDSLLNKQGMEALQRVVADALPFSAALWHLAEGDARLHSPESQAGLKQQLLSFVDKLADASLKPLLRQGLLDQFYEKLRLQRSQRGKRQHTLLPPSPHITPPLADRWWYVMLAKLLSQPSLYHHSDSNWDLWPENPRLEALLQQIHGIMAENPEISAADLKKMLDDQELIRELAGKEALVINWENQWHEKRQTIENNTARREAHQEITDGTMKDDTKIKNFHLLQQEPES